MDSSSSISVKPAKVIEASQWTLVLNQIIQAIHGHVQLPSPFNLMFHDPLPAASLAHEVGNILTYTF
jgi:hypothetical protein